MAKKYMLRLIGSTVCMVLLGLALGADIALAGDRPDIDIAVNKLARNLDPAKQTGNVDVRIYYSIYDTLIRRDFKNPFPGGGAKLIPGLATSWKRIDPTTLELKLRKGVTFHDGNPFNADDVLATFSSERLRGPKSFFPRGRVYFSHVKDVQKLDAYTGRFVTQQPDLVLEHRLSSYTAFIICDEAWNAFRKEGEDYMTWMDRAFKSMRWKPVGTGPYKFDSYRKNDFIKLTAFDGYWEGKPAAKSITFKAVPEVAARISGLVSGQYQMAVEIPPDQWKVLDRYDDVTTKSVVLDNSHVLVFNTRNEILKNKKLRHAMSLAIDRQKLIDSLWKGQTYTPNGHQLESFGAMYRAHRKGYAYDPEKAKQLVKASGYKGETITYRLIPAYYLNNVEAAQVIQEMWRQVGINAELEFVESFKKTRTESTMAYAWSNTYRIPDPTGALMANWGPNSAIQAKYKYFQPPEEFNDLGRKLFEMTEMKARADAFNRMLDIFEDEMAMTILYNPIVTFAMKSNFKWHPYTLFFMDFRPSNFSIE